MSYVYLIGWSTHDKFYYGVRYAANCVPEELWKTYFTSSRYVKEFRQQYGEPDIIQIRKVFSDPNSARLWETKFLKRMKANTHPKFLNKTNNCSISNTQEHYEKLSRKFKNTKRDPSIGIKVSQKFTEERRIDSRNKFKKYGCKSIYKIIDLSGNIITTENLKEFCVQHNLSYSRATAKAKSGEIYKGFSLSKIGTTFYIRNHQDSPSGS